MRTSHADKWIAFWLSLAVPGAGQLWAGSASCVAWWLTAGIAAAGWSWLAAEIGGGWGFTAAQVSFFLAVGVTSAEHARRRAERDRPWPPTPGTRVTVWTAPRWGRRLETRIELDLPLPPAEVWRRVSDLHRFLVIDPFHDRVTLMRPEPAAGVDLVLSHNAFGYKFFRFGRILRWRPGRGYAFSDLSPRGAGRSFPHVFFIDITPAPETALTCSRLTITVRGKWNSRWIPPILGQMWVTQVTRDHARLLHKAL